MAGLTVNNKKGFTLLEIIIVVAVLGILIAIAGIYLFRARQMARANVCASNLREIQQVIQNWTIGENMETTDVPTTADLVPVYIKAWPACPTKNVPYVPCASEDVPKCPVEPENHHL